jgi:DNA-nicking Smr family endonuclease
MPGRPAADRLNRRAGHRRSSVQTPEVTMKLTLDLHPIFRSDRDIDRALREVIFQAAHTKADTVEIISGKGSGQLMKRVLAFLEQRHIRRMYDRVETDSANDGRLFVHFRAS